VTLSRETEDVLRRARLTEAMPEARRRRIKGALIARLAVAGGVALKAGEAAGAGFWASAIGSGVKGVASLVVVASLGAGGYMVARTSRPRVAATAPAAIAPREASAHRSTPPERNTRPIEPAPAPEPRDVPSVVTNDSVPAKALRTATPAPTRFIARAPEAEREPSVAHSLAEPARTVEPPRANAVPAERSTLAEEMPLLRAADRALRAGQLEAALGWLDQHAARFPDGLLAPERSGERLIALCQLGKADRAAASSFLAKHEGTPLAARVRQACGLAGR
jgi:hypothetical protein